MFDVSGGRGLRPTLPRLFRKVSAMSSPGSGSGPPSGPTHGRAAFAFIFITVCLDMLALGMIVPVLPKLVVAFEGGNMGKAASITGVFGFVWALMQFVSSPVLGAISDRWGRRPVVLASNLGLGLDYLMMAVAPSLAWLFVGRMVSGITSATFATASAYIADVTPPEQRAGQFGKLGAAFGLGFIIGPALGGLLGNYGLRLPFWVAAGLSLANAVYGFFILPESLPPERRVPQLKWRTANPLGSLTLLRSSRLLLALAAATFLYDLAHESLPSIWVLYTTYRYQWSERAIGLSLAAVGLGSTLVSALLVGPAVKRLGERRVLLVGLAFGALGFALYGAAASSGVFFAAIPLTALWGLAGPPVQALMSREVGPSQQGQLQGAFGSMSGISGMIGPLLFTQIFRGAIAPGLPAWLPGAPYFMAAALVAASLLAAAAATRQRAG
jgi:DHA1 family tetracycline resistance protein-like MFS transporter